MPRLFACRKGVGFWFSLREEEPSAGLNFSVHGGGRIEATLEAPPRLPTSEERSRHVEA